MSNLVIVAIPDENDRVWKVSSDKIPHCTLLFLGDADEVGNVDQIVQFVEHAANTTLNRFYLPVDRRGELGEDGADVLFFRKGRYDYKAIRDFRATLLQDNNIRTAHDSAEQHDGPWLPHLTLGYPENPAKPDDTDRDYGFYDVSFTKIAVWVDDFDGPEFLLKDWWDDWEALETVPMDVAMSEIRKLSPEDIAHFGVKGMKWGVRKETDAQAYLRVGDSPQDFKEARKDAKWLKKNHGINLAAGQMMAKSDKKIFGAAQKSLKPDIKALNQRPEYSGKENKKQLKDATSELAQKYDADHTALFKQHMLAAVEQHGKTSPSGKWTEKVTVGKDGSWSVGIKQTKTAKHNVFDDSDYAYLVQPVRDADNYIVDYEMITIEDDSMSQAEDLVADLLEHHGVKGMKWGVRKARDAAVGTAKVADNVLFELGTQNKHVTNAIAQDAHKAMKKNDLPDIKAKHTEYSGLKDRVKKPLSKEARAYRADVKAAYLTRLEESANTRTNFQGNRRYTLAENGKPNTKKYTWSLKTEKIQHANDENADLDFKVHPVFDDEGYIIDFEMVTDEVAQSIEIGADFIAHFGIKGMKWGVRKPPPDAVATSATSKVPHGSKRKTKIEVEGGENHPAHQDAIKVAEARAKLKKSGTVALSNAELREVANRLQLENQVAVLTSSKGKKFVEKELETSGKKAFKTGARAAAPHVIKKAAKGAATVGVTAALL